VISDEPYNSGDDRELVGRSRLPKPRVAIDSDPVRPAKQMAVEDTGDRPSDGCSRLETRLWRTPKAVECVRNWGLTTATMRRFHLGLKEPYLSRQTGEVTDQALSFPIIGSQGWIPNRYAYLNLEGLTSNPAHPVGWGPGRPLTAFSRRPFRSASLVLVDSMVDLWLMAQALDTPGETLVVASRSHPQDLPVEWLSDGFWATWSRVTLLVRSASDEERIARLVSGRSRAPVHVISVDTDARDCLMLDRLDGVGMRALVDAAPVWEPTVHGGASEEVAPVADSPLVLEGAYHRGRMYHPVMMESATIGPDGTQERSYVVRVLRSDGQLLEASALPCPPGTPPERRVVALSDGTRIVELPRPSSFQSWSHGSLSAFMDDRAEGRAPAHRPLAGILRDLEAYLRASVWLPDPDAYAVLSLFVVAGFVHRVFEAMPILLLNGPSGSGKSELGTALASVGINAMVVGQVSGAGLIRLIDETRGLLVIDDLEAISGGTTAKAAEIGQVLKCSYKQATARKAIPGRGGRVRIHDFYGPKVVSNIGGAEAVLGTRMISIRTAPGEPVEAELSAPAVAPDALRDEMHVWAMCSAIDVERAYRPHSRSARSRADELAACLRAIAALSGELEISERLARFLNRPDTVEEDGARKAEPADLVADAVRSIIARGSGPSVSLVQIQLELALPILGTHGAQEVTPESIGRWLLALGLRDQAVPVERRRLYGVATRIYALTAAPTSVGDQGDAFSFCTETDCDRCPYSQVCEGTVEGLRTAKSARLQSL